MRLSHFLSYSCSSESDHITFRDSPQYYEIYKHKEVIGISILFMLVDMMGGVFSDLSLAFKAQFDVVAGITYSLVVVRCTSHYSLICG